MTTGSRAGRGRLRKRASTTPRFDAPMVARARAGDPDSLHRIWATAWPRLVAFFRYSGIERVQSEDLAADVLEVVVRKLRGLRHETAFEGWMWTIARNRLAGHRRRAAKEPVQLADPPPLEPGDHYEIATEHAAVRSALAQLSGRDRELLWLREVEGLSYQEIGGRTGAASGAVRVAVHRARRRLELAYEQRQSAGKVRKGAGDE